MDGGGGVAARGACTLPVVPPPHARLSHANIVSLCHCVLSCSVLCFVRSTDRDGDGHIEPKELRTVMSNLGIPMTDEQVKKVIAGVDTDGNGMIEFDEFIGIMAARMMKEDGEDEINEAFGLFAGEADNNAGYVTTENLKKMLQGMGSQKLSDSEVDELIKELGADAEGKVSFEAFKSAECWKVNSKKIEELRKRPQGANRSGGAAGSSG